MIAELLNSAEASGARPVRDNDVRIALDEEIPRPEEDADKVRERVPRLVEQSGVGEHVNLDAVAFVEVEYDALRYHRIPVVLVVVLKTYMQTLFMSHKF